MPDCSYRPGTKTAPECGHLHEAWKLAGEIILHLNDDQLSCRKCTDHTHTKKLWECFVLEYDF